MRVELTKRGDEPLTIDFEPIPVWVDRAHRYRLLTPMAADSLASGRAARNFFSDTESLLEKGL